MRAPTLPLRREARASMSRSRPSGLVTNQRVRRSGGGLPVLLPRRPRGRDRGLVQHVYRGLVRGQHVFGAASAAVIASSNRAVFSRATALSTQPAETFSPVSMPMSCADRLRARSRNRTGAPRPRSGPVPSTQRPRAVPAAGLQTSPSRSLRTPAPADRRSAVCAPSGSGSRFRPLPWWPDCPPRLRSLRRSRSDCFAWPRQENPFGMCQIG
jgi:hypothetical protein